MYIYNSLLHKNKVNIKVNSNIMLKESDSFYKRYEALLRHGPDPTPTPRVERCGVGKLWEADCGGGCGCSK